MQTQTLLTIRDNDYYQVRFSTYAYPAIWGRWRIITGAEIKIYIQGQGDNFKTQIVGPIEMQEWT